MPTPWTAGALALALAAASPAAASADPAPAQPTAEPAALRVCADPDNLPFSNDREQGLENRLAEIVAADLGLPIKYTWQSQRRGFLRRSLNAGLCDVEMGVPPGLPGVKTTRPYYRSAYVFVSRRAEPLAPHALDDPALRTVRIGIHALGMEGANTPAAQALAARGIAANVQGFPAWGDDGGGPAVGRIVDAVAASDIDVAIIWGPFAGYFGKAHGDRLTITPILSDPCLADMPFAYDIALGVRAKDAELAARLQAVLDRRQAEIAKVLKDFAIPLVPPASDPASRGAAPVQARATHSTGDTTCASRPS